MELKPDLEAFRQETRAWLAENCPASMRTRMVPGEEVNGGSKRRGSNPEGYLWLERMAARGWTVPTWPKEFGGAGLDKEAFLVLLKELQRIHARPPLGGMGVSMLGPTLFPMDSPGVTARPIKLINGHSPFCQTFLDGVEVPKDDLVHRENDGWTVAKRLLQHERSGLAALASGDGEGPLERIRPSLPLAELARHYGVEDPALYAAISDNEMLKAAFLLTRQRAVEESAAQTPGATTSIFKYVEAEYVKAQLDLQMQIRGFQGLGWEGDEFEAEALAMTRLWLEAKSISIAGGSNEVQLNIIAKRVLGLPD